MKNRSIRLLANTASGIPDSFLGPDFQNRGIQKNFQMIVLDSNLYHETDRGFPKILSPKTRVGEILAGPRFGVRKHAAARAREVHCKANKLIHCKANGEIYCKSNSLPHSTKNVSPALSSHSFWNNSRVTFHTLQSSDFTQLQSNDFTIQGFESIGKRPRHCAFLAHDLSCWRAPQSSVYRYKDPDF